MTDALILAAYSAWSEEVHCVSFLVPDEASVRDFREWLRKLERYPREPYEQRMLDEYRRQEA